MSVSTQEELDALSKKYDDFRQSLWSQIKKFEEENQIRIIIRNYDFVSIINIRPKD